MHVICDVGAMSDVRGRDRTVPDTASSGWMYESESRDVPDRYWICCI